MKCTKKAIGYLHQQLQISQNGRQLNIALDSPAGIFKSALVPHNFWDQVNLLNSKGSRVLAVASGESDKLICQDLIALADSSRNDAKKSVTKIKKY